MVVTIDPQARPCPGVEQAITKTEEKLRQKHVIYAVGELIHNRREVARLEALGLRYIHEAELEKLSDESEESSAYFLVRTHGEREAVVEEAKVKGLKILNATCPIVRRSQQIVDDHVKEGWGIIIAGKKNHAEVVGIEARTRGSATVITSIKETDGEFDDRSLLIAQTTIDPELFDTIRKELIGKIPGLKVVDTTCHYLRKRQVSISQFSAAHDIIIHVGGKNSSNGKLLYKTGKQVNERSHKVESCDEVDPAWFHESDRIGVTGCASTPRWQLDEMKYFLEHLAFEKNPKGLKNRKGGQFPWWRKKTNSTK